MGTASRKVAELLPSVFTSAVSVQVWRSSEASTACLIPVASGLTGQPSTRQASPPASSAVTCTTLPQGLRGSNPVAYFNRLGMPSPAGESLGPVWSVSGSREVISSSFHSFHVRFCPR